MEGVAKTPQSKASRKKRKSPNGVAAATPPERPLPPPSAPTFPFRTAVLLAVGAGALFFTIVTGLSWLKPSGTSSQSPRTTELTFVGSQACSGCHRTEAQLWQKSQHRHAMDHASDTSVRGDFSDAVFEYAGTRSRFFRDGRKFLVETEGPDGKLATFEVKYTFGIDPLQQYLIEFPDGRVQALSIAWDTRPKDQGGQRWFHLYPNDAVTQDDPLHWTKPSQNWNFMCAECHSTGVHKNYDAANDRFGTTFAEISVGCEACHGKGSRHLEWARDHNSVGGASKGLVVDFDQRIGVSWLADPATGLPQRSAPPPLLRKDVETCGLCHARRGQLAEGAIPGHWLSETHRVSMLDRQRFEADGQMRNDEETYNYAPFKLSKMYARGVSCSDCHDPHSAKLKAPVNEVCAQCHSPGKYASEAHQHHAKGAASLTCASCHMPVRSYMGIDRRHDHGFRVPRPDLSVRLGTSNACNDCHADRTAQWAADKITGWFGPQRRGYQGYATAFHAAWTEQPDAQALLTALSSAADVPGLARASALAELPAPDLDLARTGLADPDPMVRIGALDMLEPVPPDRLWPIASAHLSDPVPGVRIRAAELLASVSAAGRAAGDSEAFSLAAAEFVAAQRLNADRPEARTALGNFYARRGEASQAQAEYRAAIRLDSSFSAAAINLSDLFRELGRDADGERVLRDALSGSAREASLHHALGLVLVRQKRPDEALEELRRATTLQPERARYAYIYAVALHAAGRREDALAALNQSLRRHPNDPEALSAALAFSREKGDAAAALGFAERLSALLPDSRELAELVKQLRR